MMIKRIFQKEKRTVLVSLICGFCVSVIFTAAFSIKLYADNIQIGIAEKIIRLHILANSDSETDQRLKLAVRDGIIELMSEKMESCKSRQESLECIKNMEGEIKNRAEEILKAENCFDNVSVSISKSLFPVKKYGDIVLPSGYYDSLKIVIGKGEGHNWWCVMYPAMCFYDSDGQEQVSKSELKNILNSEEYSVISDFDSINIKFAAVDAVKKIEAFFN